MDELNLECPSLTSTQAESGLSTLFTPIGQPSVRFSKKIPQLTDEYVAGLSRKQNGKKSAGVFIGLLMDHMFTREEERDNRCTAIKSFVRGSKPPMYKYYGQLCPVRLEIIQRCVCAFYPECISEYFNVDFTFTNAFRKTIHSRGQKY